MTPSAHRPGSDDHGRPTEVYVLSALVEEANRRLATRFPDTEPLSERAVRYYVSRGLMHRGYTRTQISPDAVIHPNDGALSGNTRFFVEDDIEVAVGIKIKAAQGRPIDEAGFAGPDRVTAPSSAAYSLSPDITELSFISPIVNAEEFPTLRSPRLGSGRSAASRIKHDLIEPEVSTDITPLPHVEAAWTLELRPGLTLVGDGPTPPAAAVRQLMKVVHEHLPAPMAPRPTGSGRLQIDIELNDIVAPFHGAIVNASNAELRPGGGVAGRVWEVCGEGELELERARHIKALPLRPGDAVLTGPGRGADRGFTGVIHALGPRWLSGFDRHLTEQGQRQISEHGEEEALIRTWRSVLRLADEHGITQIAAPMISAGIFGYPVPDNFDIAFHTLFTTPTDVERIVIRTISRRTFDQLKESRRKVRESLNIG